MAELLTGLPLRVFSPPSSRSTVRLKLTLFSLCDCLLLFPAISSPCPGQFCSNPSLFTETLFLVPLGLPRPLFTGSALISSNCFWCCCSSFKGCRWQLSLVSIPTSTSVATTSSIWCCLPPATSLHPGVLASADLRENCSESSCDSSPDSDMGVPAVLQLGGV